MAAHRCNTHTQRRRPKPRGPGATGSRQRALGGSAVTPYQRSGAAEAQERWIGPKVAQGAKGPENDVHRESRGASLKHRARDAGEKADLRFLQYGRRPWPGSPFRFGVARCRSPWVRSTPGVPRALGLIRRRNRPNDSGADALREGESVCAMDLAVIPKRILVIRSSRQSKFVHE